MRAVVQLGALLLLAGLNTYGLIMRDTPLAWIWAGLFGVLYPILGIYEWTRLRKQASPAVADRIMVWLLAGQAAMSPFTGWWQFAP